MLRSNAVNPPGLPFPDGVRVGELVFLSGQIGNKPGTLELPAGGIEPETPPAVRESAPDHGDARPGAVRHRARAGDARRHGEWQRFNAVYLEFFPDAAPARCAFGTSGLALGARVEVEAFAVRR